MSEVDSGAGAAHILGYHLLPGTPMASDALLSQLLSALVAALQLEAGVDLASWLLALARLIPSLALVPGLGLGVLPLPTRIAIGLSLTASAGWCRQGPTTPLSELSAGRIVYELGAGMPLALAATVSLWAAVETGAVADWLRQDPRRRAVAGLGLPATSLGTVLGLLSVVGFLGAGGPARLASASLWPAPKALELPALAAQLVLGIDLAVHLAAPLLAGAVVLGLTQGLLGRLFDVRALGNSARALLLLCLAAILLESTQEALQESLGAALRPG